MSGERSLGLRASLLLASSLTVLSGAIISPALPSIREAFSGTPNIDLYARLVLTMPAIAIAIMAPLAGGLADRFGRLPLLFGGLFLYALGGGSGLVAESVPILLAGRALLGVAVGLIMTAASTLIADYFHGAERGRFLGLQAAFMSGGGIVFMLMGGALASLGWRAPFAAYLLSLPLIALVWRAVQEPDRLHPQHEDESPANLNTARVATLYAAWLLGMVLLYLLPVQLSFWLREHVGPSPMLPAMAISLNAACGTAIALSFGRLRARFAAPRMLIATFVLAALGLGLLSIAPGYVVVLLAMVPCGVGFGLLMPHVSLWLADLAPERMRGRVMGGGTSVIFLGQFLSPIVFQPIVGRHGLAGPGGVFGWGAGLALVLAGVFAWSARRG